MHLSSQTATVTKSSTQLLQEGKNITAGNGVTIANKKLILAVPLSQGVAIADHSTRMVYTRCPS